MCAANNYLFENTTESVINHQLKFTLHLYVPQERRIRLRSIKQIKIYKEYRDRESCILNDAKEKKNAMIDITLKATSIVVHWMGREEQNALSNRQRAEGECQSKINRKK